MFIDDGFNDTVEYKGILLRRLTLRDGYYMIKASGEALTVNLMSEKDLELLGLPYLTYIYRKALKDSNYVSYWQILKWCLYKSFVDCDIDVREDGIIVYKKKEDYLNYADEYYSILASLEILAENIRDNEDEIIEKIKQKEDIENVIYEKIELNCMDFDKIKDIICKINGFDNTKYDPHWESILKEAKDLKNSISEDGLTLSDLINTLAFYLRKFPTELKDMDYYVFNHYVKLMGDFEEYKLNRSAELQGTEFKQKINHWFTHYKPMGKYDDVVTDSNVTKELE